MTIGQTDLPTLLSTLTPHLRQEEFVYCTVPTLPAGLDPVCMFREAEGITLVIPRAIAETLGINFTYPCRMITLAVHSSLEAVGFLAAITARLAAAGISVNPVSAYHHDHLFVPTDKADAAMRILASLARE